jgi:hypothetical protein
MAANVSSKATQWPMRPRRTISTSAFRVSGRSSIISRSTEPTGGIIGIRDFGSEELNVDDPAAFLSLDTFFPTIKVLLAELGAHDFPEAFFIESRDKNNV